MISEQRTPAFARIRPMDLGAIFDGAIAVYRRHFWSIIGAIAVMVVPVALLRGFAAMAPSTRRCTGRGGPAAVRDAHDHPGDRRDRGRRRGAGPAGDRGSVWRRMGRLIWPVFATTLLVLFAVAGGALLGGFPAVLIYVWFAFAAQIVVLEDKRYGQALGRSRQLVKNSWWRVFGILALAAFLVNAASGVLTAAAAGLTGDNILVGVVVSSAIAIMIAPITALISALLYFDLRLRHDGTDILAAVENL